MRPLALLFLFNFFCIEALSADIGVCVTSACAQVRITRLYTEASGAVYIGTSGDETKLNCKASANVYITLPKSAPGFDTIYASLLAYQMAGDPVNLRIVDGSDGCLLSYATFDKNP